MVLTPEQLTDLMVFIGSNVGVVFNIFDSAYLTPSISLLDIFVSMMFLDVIMDFLYDMIRG